MSNARSLSGSNNPNAKIVINKQTNEIIGPAKVAALALNISDYKLRKALLHSIPIGGIVYAYADESKAIQNESYNYNPNYKPGPKPGTIVTVAQKFESQILELYNHGMCCAMDISRELKLRHQTVRDVMKSHGLVSKQQQNHSTLDIETQKKIVQDYQSGKTIIEICNERNLKRGRVKRVLDKHKVDIKTVWNKVDIDNTTGQTILDLRCKDLLTVPQIAEKLHIPKPTVKNFLREHLKVDELPRFTEYDRLKTKSDEVKELYASGLSGEAIAKKYGVTGQTVLKLLREFEVDIRPNTDYFTRNSAIETEIKEFICSIVGKENVKSDRTVLKNIESTEIDIYIESKKIGFEVNGVYFHSELGGKTREYHITKTLEAKRNGVSLYHILDVEWKNKKEIVKSFIRSKLGAIETSVYARKCQVIPVNTKDAREFLDTNHIQGFVGSKYYFGLYYKEELVALMSFGANRFEKDKMSWELHRYAVKLNTSVVGGFSKLLGHFRKEHRERIVSYADIRFSVGNVYEKNGFKFLGRTNPNYSYFKKSGTGILESRQNYMKHKLERLFPDTYNPLLGEWENMKLAGFNRIWDCGNWKFQLN